MADNLFILEYESERTGEVRIAVEKDLAKSFLPYEHYKKLEVVDRKLANNEEVDKREYNEYESILLSFSIAIEEFKRKESKDDKRTETHKRIMLTLAIFMLVYLTYSIASVVGAFWYEGLMGIHEWVTAFFQIFILYCLIYSKEIASRDFWKTNPIKIKLIWWFAFLINLSMVAWFLVDQLNIML